METKPLIQEEPPPLTFIEIEFNRVLLTFVIQQLISNDEQLRFVEKLNSKWSFPNQINYRKKILSTLQTILFRFLKTTSDALNMKLQKPR